MSMSARLLQWNLTSGALLKLESTACTLDCPVTGQQGVLKGCNAAGRRA